MRFNLYLCAAMLALAAPAAAVTYTSAPGAPDPGPATGEQFVVTFDAPAAAGYSWSGGLQTATGNLGSVYAAPALDNTVFGYVSSANTPNTATLKTPSLKSISFYWGSIDTYNKLEVLDSVGNVLATVNGADISAANGNQTAPATNRRIYLSADPGEAIGGLRFTSTGIAFEFDDFAASAVPEPATWAMLIAGFGLVGAAARRRRGVGQLTA
jgi:hypothetical protein